ncbi:monovalent cation/H+ antiporter complex subunit F [Lentibacillus sediminis]|uniref:monovalent cation/H+ antiporter complex subunit F n=1 Tax=Lentibacillus sediminis TaxID=1940529 RepID=UPI000C1C0742|nr:monovalent cation/H+ antiporter complex subunit F [Lentibacillus sediminis]
MTAMLEITEQLVTISAVIALAAIAAAILMVLYRLLKGPTQPDRAVALDLVAINMMGVAAILAVMLGTQHLNDVVLLIGILAFLGTLAIAKYLERGVIIDRDR